MKRALVSMLITLALLLAGCSYSNSEIYYAYPIPGDSATLVVTTNLDSLDRVVITDSLIFKYSAQIEGGALYFTQASIRSFTLYQYATNYDPDTITGPYVLTDSFWIFRDMATDTGIYSMLFTLYFSSNTNSLGDKVGIEADILNLDFDLVVEGGDK